MSLWTRFSVAVLAALAGAMPLELRAQEGAAVAAALGYPDQVLYNAKIVTVDDPQVNQNVGTIVEAMAVRDGRILATGTTAAMRGLAGPKTKLVDLRGRTVLPGLIMTHEHPMDWMFQEQTAWEQALPLASEHWLVRFLPPGPPEQAIERVLPILKEMVGQAGPGKWIYLVMDRATDLQWGQATQRFFPGFRTDPGSLVVTKEALDRIAPNNPVLVKNGWTTGVLNSKALEVIEQQYPGFEGFQPNGGPMAPAQLEEFKKTPASLSRGIVPDVIMRGRTPDLAKLAKASSELWGAYGVTTFASSPYSSANFQAYSYLDRRGEMPIRYAWGYQGPDFSEEALSTVAGILGHGSDYMWNIGSWGLLGTNCTTIEARPEVKARERCSFEPGSWGRDVLDRIVRTGGRVATMHTEGDKDIDYLMDSIEQESAKAQLTLEDIKARRHAFDHTAGAPRPEQLPRMKRLGMVVSNQNGYLIYGDTSSTAFYARNYGEEYTCWVVPKQTLLKAGIPMGFEVDKPVPWLLFQRVHDGITRYNPTDEKVHCPKEKSDRILELKSMTTWAAYYTLAEKRLGSLERGKLADFVVLDRDYLTIPEVDIPNVRVLMTVVGGKTIHLVPSLASELKEAPVGPVTWKDISVPYLRDEARRIAGR
jgi:predicted amidohydrolase YtcJ